MSAGLMSGYKRTEVGVVPTDWQVCRLGDIATTSSGTTPPRSLSERYYRNGTVPWVKTLDLDDRPLADTEERVTLTALKETSLRMCPPGTVLVAMYGGFNQIGRTGLLRMSAVTNQALVGVRANEDALDPEYLLANLNFRVDHWKSVASSSSSSSSSRKDANITSEDVRSFLIACPPVAEQQVIAKALGDTDSLIESLEQLIAKKRHIKQGAMQELLQPKDGWVVRTLSQLADIRSGGTPSTNRAEYWDGGVPWCTPTDITALKGQKYLTTTSRTITSHGLKASSAEMIPSGSVVMTSRATIGECAINRVPLATNQGFKNFVPFQGTEAEFLYYLLLTKKQDFVGLCSGSTFLEIGKTQLVGFEVALPTQPSEQTAIATILSDMDAELTALEAKLTKTRQLKQGMMRELLTGRIRLV